MKSDIGPNQEVTLWLGATRYYLGRMTYAVSDFCELLQKKWPHFTERTRDLLIATIEREFERDDEFRSSGSEHLPLGMDCDRAEWEKVRRLWLR